MDCRRVFFALWPTAPAAARLHQLARRLQATHGGRVMRRNTLHMTLAFVGDIEAGRIAWLMAIGERVVPQRFEMVIDGVGGWPRQKLVWAAPSHTEPPLAQCVADLHEQLAAAGFLVDTRTFKPHLTLLRNVGDVPETFAVPPITWSVTDLVLVESRRAADGANYSVLARWPFRSPAQEKNGVM